MILLTAKGAFAQAYSAQFDATIASFLELGEKAFIEEIKKAQVVIHNASTINCKETEYCLSRNFDFTRYLITTLQEHNPEVHLIVLSSMSILDASNDQQYGSILEMSPYAYSKYLAETYALKSALAQVSCVRFSTLFYRDPAKDGLSKLIHDAATTQNVTIYDGGTARRNFLPLPIAAQYIEKLSRINPAPKRTYNIAAEQSVSFHEVVALLQKLVPDLHITDQSSDHFNPVLSEFRTEDIQALGTVPFSLEEEITSYFNSLRS